jgi:hypothetical protein
VREVISLKKGPDGLMARRCFPVTLIGKDCGFESRSGRSFAVLVVSPLFCHFWGILQVGVERRDEKEIRSDSGKSYSTSNR